MTAEQRLAFTDFRELVTPLRLRVKADPEGFPIAPGRYGQLEWYGDSGHCAALTNRPRLFSRIWEIPEVRRHQTGDREMRAIVPIEALGAVAAVIRARRRFSSSRAQLKNLVAAPRQGTSGPQNAPFASQPARGSAPPVSGPSGGLERRSLMSETNEAADDDASGMRVFPPTTETQGTWPVP
jgi:hypothetical protein